MAKNISKRAKAIKRESKIPPAVYSLGLASKTFFTIGTGFSLMAFALGGNPSDIANFFLQSTVGRVILFLMGASLSVYQVIELIRKHKKAPKIIKKL